MTHRERMLRAFEYRYPDKIPVYYHPSPAGLYVHGQKLLDLFNAYLPDNAIRFDGLPGPEPGTIDSSGRYRMRRTDEWGTEWEYNIFGIQGHPKSFPLADYDALEEYRFPQAPAIGSAQFQADRRAIAAERDEFLVFRGGVSLFEHMQKLRPMEEVLMDIYGGDERFLTLLDMLVDFHEDRIRYHLEAGADVLMFGDDWGFQNAPVISIDHFRRIYAPRYRRLFAPVKAAGAKVLFHSCGKLDGILDELIDLGVDCFWHQVNRVDPVAFAETCRQHGAAAFIHPDRQRLVPMGSPEEIRDYIRRFADLYHGLGGGGVFYIEIENDAPFENVKALIEAVHEYR